MTLTKNEITKYLENLAMGRIPLLLSMNLNIRRDTPEETIEALTKKLKIMLKEK